MNNNSLYKQILISIFLIIICVIIWFIGPMIAINNYLILQSFGIRLILILLIMLSVGSYYFMQQWATLKLKYYAWQKIIAKEITPKIYDENLAEIQKHFSEIIVRCKTFNSDKNSSSPNTPVHLILGPLLSGKNTLLSESNLIDFTLPHREKNILELEHNSENQNNTILEHDNVQNEFLGGNTCYWNIVNKKIFLTTPGTYATANINDKIGVEWENLLKLLKKNDISYPLSSVIITLNIAKIATQEKRHTNLEIHLLKQRLLEIRTHFNRSLPLYIIFTQCDQIAGFMDYFAYLNLEERIAPFGITFSTEKNAESITKQFKKNYTELLQNINSWVITRLHQERNDKKREFIRNFPLQLELLEKNILYIIYHLVEKTNYANIITPQGVYFTSAKQNGQFIDLLENSVNKTLNSTNKILIQSTHYPCKPYFIQKLIEKITEHTFVPKEIFSERKKFWLNYSISGTGILIVLISSILMARHFTHNLITANELQQQIYTYQLLSQKVHNPKIQQKAVALLSQSYTQIGNFWLFQHNIELPSSMHQFSKNIAQNPFLLNFIPQLAHSLEQTLINNNTPPNELYDDLKIYLMLGNPKQMDINFLIHWLQQKESPEIAVSKINLGNLRIAFINALAHNLKGITLNSMVIAQARQVLNNLPKQYLAYLILKSNAEELQNNNIVIRKNNSFLEKTITIPFLYTAQGFQTFFLNNYIRAATDAVAGNKILGIQSSSNTNIINNVATELVNLYISDYMNYWNNKFYYLQINPKTNLQDMVQLFSQIADPQSGLVSLLKVFQQNTLASSILPVTANPTNPEINNLRNLLQQKLSSALQQINAINLLTLQQALTQFNTFLNTLANTNNVDQASFVIALQQANPQIDGAILRGFNGYIAQLPQPLQQWFQNISGQIWQAIIKNTASYIQQQWQDLILPTYNNSIKNHYPFTTDALLDVNLQAFTTFFAPNGIFETFFRTYLKPFINTQQSTWTWKLIDQQSLPFDDSVLSALERGRIISAMFFSNHSQHIDLHFRLQQIALGTNVRTFQLSLNGETLSDNPNSHTIKAFTWPGNNDAERLILTFQNSNGQNTTTQSNSDWSWFRLLDTCAITATQDPRQYDVLFTMNGYQAKYKLTAENEINPFIPDIISKFILPENL